MTKLAEKYDLHDPIFTICETLGIDAKCVLSMTLSRDEAVLTVALLNDDGAKYIDESGEIAAEVHYFSIKS